MICLGLNYIHCQGFVHRDISPINLFLKKKSIGEGNWLLIGDLGLARNLREKKSYFTMNKVGNIFYCPPEFFEEEPQASDKIDSWSSGVVLY
jgi:serine/threonine protein kinase